MANEIINPICICQESCQYLCWLVSGKYKSEVHVCSYCRSSKASGQCQSCGASDGGTFNQKPIFTDNPADERLHRKIERYFEISHRDLLRTIHEFSEKFIKPCVDSIYEELEYSVGHLGQDRVVIFGLEEMESGNLFEERCYNFRECVAIKLSMWNIMPEGIKIMVRLSIKYGVCAKESLVLSDKPLVATA